MARVLDSGGHPPAEPGLSRFFLQTESESQQQRQAQPRGRKQGLLHPQEPAAAQAVADCAERLLLVSGHPCAGPRLEAACL